MKQFKWWYAAFLIALLTAVLLPLASSSPDGLEKMALDNGFAGVSVEPILKIWPDYMIPGVANPTTTMLLSGMVGVLILFGIGYGIAKLLRVKK